MGAEFPWERPLGARVVGDGQVEFRVWAPRGSRGSRGSDSAVSVLVGGESVTLSDAGYGIYEAVVAARAGDDYCFVLGEERLPDPCSRWQPEGLRGPSRVVDLGAAGAGAGAGGSGSGAGSGVAAGDPPAANFGDPVPEGGTESPFTAAA